MADGDLREARGARDLRDEPLVLGIAVGVHEHDRRRVEPSRARARERGAYDFEIGLGFDRAVGEDALVDLDDVGIELVRLEDVQREDVWPRLVADLERVAEAARRHQDRALAPSFEQGVGGDRGAHLDDADRAGGDRSPAVEAEKIADRLDGRILIGRTFGQQLSSVQPAARIATDHVGEGAPAIDPEVPRFGCPMFACAGHSKPRNASLN